MSKEEKNALWEIAGQGKGNGEGLAIERHAGWDIFGSAVTDIGSLIDIELQTGQGYKIDQIANIATLALFGKVNWSKLDKRYSKKYTIIKNFLHIHDMLNQSLYPQPQPQPQLSLQSVNPNPITPQKTAKPHMCIIGLSLPSIIMAKKLIKLNYEVTILADSKWKDCFASVIKNQVIRQGVYFSDQQQDYRLRGILKQYIGITTKSLHQEKPKPNPMLQYQQQSISILNQLLSQSPTTQNKQLFPQLQHKIAQLNTQKSTKPSQRQNATKQKQKQKYGQYSKQHPCSTYQHLKIKQYLQCYTTLSKICNPYTITVGMLKQYLYNYYPNSSNNNQYNGNLNLNTNRLISRKETYCFYADTHGKENLQTGNVNVNVNLGRQVGSDLGDVRLVYYDRIRVIDTDNSGGCIIGYTGGDGKQGNVNCEYLVFDGCCSKQTPNQQITQHMHKLSQILQKSIQLHYLLSSQTPFPRSPSPSPSPFCSLSLPSSHTIHIFHLNPNTMLTIVSINQQYKQYIPVLKEQIVNTISKFVKRDIGAIRDGSWAQVEYYRARDGVMIEGIGRVDGQRMFLSIPVTNNIAIPHSRWGNSIIESQMSMNNWIIQTVFQNQTKKRKQTKNVQSKLINSQKEQQMVPESANSSIPKQYAPSENILHQLEQVYIESIREIRRNLESLLDGKPGRPAQTRLEHRGFRDGVDIGKGEIMYDIGFPVVANKCGEMADQQLQQQWICIYQTITKHKKSILNPTISTPLLFTKIPLLGKIFHVIIEQKKTKMSPGLQQKQMTKQLFIVYHTDESKLQQMVEEYYRKYSSLKSAQVLQGNYGIQNVYVLPHNIKQFINKQLQQQLTNQKQSNPCYQQICSTILSRKLEHLASSRSFSFCHSLPFSCSFDILTHIKSYLHHLTVLYSLKSVSIGQIFIGFFNPTIIFHEIMEMMSDSSTQKQGQNQKEMEIEGWKEIKGIFWEFRRRKNRYAIQITNDGVKMIRRKFVCCGETGYAIKDYQWNYGIQFEDNIDLQLDNTITNMLQYGYSEWLIIQQFKQLITEQLNSFLALLSALSNLPSSSSSSSPLPSIHQSILCHLLLTRTIQPICPNIFSIQLPPQQKYLQSPATYCMYNGDTKMMDTCAEWKDNQEAGDTGKGQGEGRDAEEMEVEENWTGVYSHGGFVRFV